MTHEEFLRECLLQQTLCPKIDEMEQFLWGMGPGPGPMVHVYTRREDGWKEFDFTWFIKHNLIYSLKVFTLMGEYTRDPTHFEGWNTLSYFINNSSPERPNYGVPSGKLLLYPTGCIKIVDDPQVVWIGEPFPINSKIGEYFERGSQTSHPDLWRLGLTLYSSPTGLLLELR